MTTTSANGAKVDGRRARGIRTRDAIVDALMTLVAEGDMAPTAQRIADRADVSVRSVYQHFTDVEGLYRETAARAYKTMMAMVVDINPSWPIERRVDAFVAARSTLLEELSPISRASRVVEASSTALRDSRLMLEKEGRDELARVFGPELSKLQGAARSNLLAAMDLLSTWSAWDHLRTAGTTTRTARQVMRTGLLALLRGSEQ